MIKLVHSDLLYLSDAFSARDHLLIYEHQFQAVVDLAADEPPATPPRDLIYCRFPLHDDGSNDDALLVLAIECVESLVRRRRRTLVACSAGMSRSPTVAACAVSLLTGDSFSDCLSEITAGNPHDISPALESAVDRVHRKIVAKFFQSRLPNP